MTDSPLTTDTTHVLRGAAYVLASGIFFTLAGVAVRVAAETVPLETIVFFRNLFAMAAFAPWLLVSGMKGLSTAVPGLHAVRTAAGLSAMYCYYYALTAIPLADAVLLNFTGPVFTPLIALIWFGLAIHRGTLFALLVGFLGVALIVRPEGLMLDPAAGIGLLAGLLGAVSVVAIWRMGSGEPAARIVFYYTAGSTLVSALPMLLTGEMPAEGDTWAALMLCGGLSALAHLLFAKGCSIAPADRTNALSYGSVLFAALLGWRIWDEQPGIELLAGTLLIAASATMVTRQRSQVKRSQTQRSGAKR